MRKPKPRMRELPKSIQPLKHPRSIRRKSRPGYFVPRLTGLPALDSEILDPAYQPKPLSSLDVDLMARVLCLSPATIQLHVDEVKAPEDQCEALFRQFNLESPDAA